ncbi:MAG: glycoside hydrolase family 88 protein [Anaerolineae bacterium]|nr:glycoside hydrolase family 88 protein [Anaerolineae bacterium]
MADTVMARHPLLSRRWHYEPGVVLLAMCHVWRKTGDQKYYDYIRSNIDEFVGPDGGIRTYRLEEYNIDQINEGKLLFPLYDTTGDERYRKAACLLRKQLETHPRTAEGGFWHKLVYPHQMWLDGTYMALPFYAEFARRFDEPGGFDDVAGQIALVARRTRDDKTGLFYHGWDESKSQQWADPKTGCSPCFWGRALGWYVMTLLDVLDHFPKEHPQLGNLLAILSDLATAVISVQDEASGVWYQVLDQNGRGGNYLEASASCMFVYALAKGVRKGYLPPGALDAARRGYDGILSEFVTVNDSGLASLHRICAVGGLGGKPYRDGSFHYYVGEKVLSNDYKGVGAFMLASLEMERSGLPPEGDLA